MVPHDDMPGELSSPGAVPIAAQRQQSGSLLLSKGTFIDCTLETAIDSTLPGITSCVTASDTFSSNGRVVLLERGTRPIRADAGSGATGCREDIRAVDRSSYA